MTQSEREKPMTPISPDTITLRPADSGDEAFLFGLYRNIRAEEMAAWGWPEAQQQMFLELQFRARNSAYSTYPNQEHSIIVNADQPIGRILVSLKEDEFRLVDIALLDEARGQGIGAKLIVELFDRARQEHLPVRLHVDKFSRTVRLYQRLGFQILEDTGTQYFMEWRD